MRLTLPFALCLILAACGTPQQQCVARETRDLRIVNRLIAETETNLARGYALERVTVEVQVWGECEISPGLRNRPRPHRLCLEDEETTVTRPRAIDPVAEQRKLAGLLDRRRSLERAAAASVAACRAQYPE